MGAPTDEPQPVSSDRHEHEASKQLDWRLTTLIWWSITVGCLFVSCLFGSAFFLGSGFNDRIVVAVDGEHEAVPIQNCVGDRREEAAAAETRPWYVQLMIYYDYGLDTHLCGGTLIAADWVVTAAHCIQPTCKRLPIQVRAYAGITSACNVTNLPRDSVQIRTGYFASSQYRTTSGDDDDIGSRLGHDIALIRLSEPFELCDRVQPICVSTRDQAKRLFRESGRCIVVGLGYDYDERQRWNVKEAALDKSTRTVDFCTEPPAILGSPAASASLCAKCRNQFLCTFVENQLGSVCLGDSGGPVACLDDNNVWSLVGVIAGSVGSCTGTLVQFATSVGYYHEWIKGDIG